MPDTMHCPCGSGLDIQACCQPYLRGDLAPPDAESLMRSRYTAYVLEDAAYLLTSWHPATRPATGLTFDQAARPQWLGLAIKRRAEIDAEHAVVEFVARYKINSRAFRMHETSRFERIEGRWFYLDGEVD
jgi:SEC-C motif-containing protein